MELLAVFLILRIAFVAVTSSYKLPWGFCNLDSLRTSNICLLKLLYFLIKVQDAKSCKAYPIHDCHVFETLYCSSNVCLFFLVSKLSLHSFGRVSEWGLSMRYLHSNSFLWTHLKCFILLRVGVGRKACETLYWKESHPKHTHTL